MLVVFDLDDTLINTHGSVLPPLMRWILKEIENQMGGFNDFEKMLAHMHQIDQYAPSAGAGFLEFAQIYDIPKELVQFGLDKLYHHALFLSHARAKKGAIELLEDLVDAGHNLALVSKGVPSHQRKKMQAAGIDEKLFKACYFDEGEGKGKFYKLLLERVKNRGQNAVVCGDRIKSDLSPAKLVGMKTVQIRSGRGLGNTGFKTHVDYTIVSLEQLKDILRILERDT